MLPRDDDVAVDVRDTTILESNILVNLLRTTLLIIAITLMILIILMIMAPKNQYGCNHDNHDYIDDNNDYVDNDRRMIMAKMRIMMMTILHVVPT